MTTQDYFNFRIIQTANGCEVIDESLKTPFNSLEPSALVDYFNVENMLFAIHRDKQKETKTKNTFTKQNYISRFFEKLKNHL